MFSKTNSLGIKVRGLQAFVVLCGGTNDPATINDGLDGIMNSNTSKKSSSTALDKYTMQEKIVPLVKGIKTKEPAVAIAALNVLRQVGGVVDAEYVAMDVLPILWNMSLGPLLNLQQFQSFMELIKSLSSRVEAEQTKKLQELSSNNGSLSKGNDDFMSFDTVNAFSSQGGSDDQEIDFERLVKGNTGGATSINNTMDGGWDATQAHGAGQRQQNNPVQAKPVAFSWSTPSPTNPGFAGSTNSLNPVNRQTQQGPISRTITPDMSRFESLTPSATQFSQPLQPQSNYKPSEQSQPNYVAPPIFQSQNSFTTPLQTHNYNNPLQPPPQTQSFPSYQSTPAPVNWGAGATSNPWGSPPASNPTASLNNLGNSMSSLSMAQTQKPAMSNSNSFSLPPPPAASSSFNPPLSSAYGQAKPQQKSGLDAFESLL